MKNKLLICVCFIIALALGPGHFVYAADNSNCQTAYQCLTPKKSDGGKQTQSSSKKNSTPADGAVTAGADGPSTFLTFIKLIFSLAIILGLIYLLFRVVSKKTRAYKNDGAIKNVGGVSVGTNKSVQLIRVGDDILVVGVGDSVNLIKEITDPDKVEELLNQEPDEPDMIQKNVSKVVHWAKERAGKFKPPANQTNGLPKTFDQQLKQLLKLRTREVEKRLGKETHDDDTRNSN